jgi:hypothetical protein
MFEQLPTYLQAVLAENQANLPRNPQNAAQINAKIVMLQRPTLAVEMSAGRMFSEATVTSMDGGPVEIAVVFPEERMRADAGAAVRVVTQALPILERFIGITFPAPTVRIWYGFKVGNSGGGGSVFAEDRTSYESRPFPNQPPYDALFAHELSHSYISTEVLTQFLELYVYNQMAGASTDLTTWPFTRGYTGIRDDNRDSALMLDVYQMIGHEPMSRAYNAVYPLRPRYGQPLPADAIQTFVEQAPEPVKSQVAAKLARIVF